MRWLRKRSPVVEAEDLIKKHKKRVSLPKGEPIKIARLIREVKDSNLSESRKSEILEQLRGVLTAHKNAAHEFFRFQEWAKSRNKGKMPKGLKLKKLELEWIMEYGKD